jgi:hypothetical protein
MISTIKKVVVHLKMTKSTYLNEEIPLNKKETRKISHNIIEKRRREKVNLCLSHLCNLVPSCSQESESLQKLTILERTVEYIKQLHREWPSKGLECPPSPSKSPELYSQLQAPPSPTLSAREHNPIMSIANLIC